MRNLIAAFIQSNIFIALAAVLLTVETQIQLDMQPQFHPYLFLIFFATLFEYNLHRLITVITNKEAVLSNKHSWVGKNLTLFYALVAVSLLGFIIAVALAKKEVLIALAPLAALTIFYSTPLAKSKHGLFRLRQLPFAKIFMIAFVWSTITILLPIIQSGKSVNTPHLTMLIVERFLFVFAITIPFDIRDMQADKKYGLKTIPLLIGEKRSIQLSIVFLIAFSIVSVFHYKGTNQQFILWAFLLSGFSTLIFLTNKKIKQMDFYHYGVLDGTMILQALLVFIFHFICR